MIKPCFASKQQFTDTKIMKMYSKLDVQVRVESSISK